MARVDVSQGARELVDLNAEAVGALGQHLEQIGHIIAASSLKNKRADNITAKRVKDKLDIYEEYVDDVERRRREVEDKMSADFARLKAWRQNTGTEGASLLDELTITVAKCKQLDEDLRREEGKVAREKQKVRLLLESRAKKERTQQELSEVWIRTEEMMEMDTFARAAFSSWVQSTFDEVRFKWKAGQEKEKLRIEHHQKMRKARCQARLNTIHREQAQRWLQKCFLVFQEECIEARHVKACQQLRRRHEDETLVLRGQVAQLLGDEEAAKELVAVQMRNMEEARNKQREAERLQQVYLREAREAKADAECARSERDRALEAQARAEARADTAEAAEQVALGVAADATARADAADAAKAAAEERARRLNLNVKKKIKKIESLQRMLAELGAESDSDAAPDERPPPFFVEDDGTMVPRPRNRKERMGMAYREAETSRFELRLGLATMIDKDVDHEQMVARLRDDLRFTEQEVDEVRWANKVLIADVNAIAAAAAACRMEAAERPGTAMDSPRTRPTSTLALADRTVADGVVVFKPDPVLAHPPLSPSTARAPPWDPTRPQFMPATGMQMRPDSPHVLLKVPSAPVLMPPLCKDSVVGKGAFGEKIVLAPLRKKNHPSTKRRSPSEWRVNWS